MSKLPQKKKTAEELEALRKSLGISQDEEAAPQPGATPERVDALPPDATAEGSPAQVAPEAAPDPVEKPQPGGGVPKPSHSLRKSGNLIVDKPKKVPSHSESGNLPARRHSDEELIRMRKAQFQGPTQAAAHLTQLTASPLALVLIYGFGLLGVLVAGLGAWSMKLAKPDLPFDWLARSVDEPWFRSTLYGLLVAGGVVMLLGAGWIQWKKKRSSHHAGILTILAVLVLVFGTLYFFPQLHGA